MVTVNILGGAIIMIILFNLMTIIVIIIINISCFDSRGTGGGDRNGTVLQASLTANHIGIIIIT